MIYKIIDEQPFQVLTSSFSIGPSETGYELCISADGENYSPLFSVGSGVTRLVTNVASGSYYKLEGNEGEVSVNWRTSCKGEGGGGGEYILPPATSNTLGGVKIGSGITVQPDGTISISGGGESVVYVSHLSDAEAVAAPEGTLIVLNNDSEHSIYIKVEGGEVASWVGYVSSSQDTPIEIIYDNYEDFVGFADGKVLFAFKYRYGSNYRYAVVDKDEEAIILYSDSALTTEITRASYLGNAVNFVSADQSIRAISVHWKEDEITLRITTGYIDTANLMDFSTEGVHYHRITDPTKATAQDLGIANYDEGIPRWNNEGVIIGKRNDYITKGIQFNYGSNSYSNKATVVVEGGGSNIPDRVYVPIAGGSSGQILVSNGTDAAPTFQTLIKAQKITSAEYEALSVKDPNTLYLIDDES